jgi:hypothetical protein
MLREQGYYVVAAATPDGAIELLHNPEYQFSGVIAQGSPTGGWLARVFELIRSEHLPVLTLLHIKGCHQDDIPAPLLALADLVIEHDRGLRDFLARLRQTLASATPPQS